MKFDHPENERVLRCLKRHWDGTPPQNLSAPPSVYELYSNALGTHPDLADYFWNSLTAKLPERCAWVAYGNPVLVRPKSAVIFGFAGGTHTYALRLPEEAMREAVVAGAKRIHIYSNGTQLSLADVGDEWIFGGWFKEEPAWCLSAYHMAGSISRI